MLFDHRVRPEWSDRIEAVRHVDGTARLQTINERQCPITAAILEAFADESGVPVLCNTSANLPGRGAFPDVESAARWDAAGAIWSVGTLYQRRDPPLPQTPAEPRCRAHSLRYENCQRWSRVKLHFTPTSGSWINLVERWFSERTTRVGITCAARDSGP
jgi:hypothetical protein